VVDISKHTVPGDRHKAQSTNKKHLTAGRVISVNISDRKGTSKMPVKSISLKKGFGVENDAHGGSKRQVSILAVESLSSLKGAGNHSNQIEIKPGLFAENITTELIDLSSLSVGDIINIGQTQLCLTEKGKVCPRKCSIYYKLGDCIMPKEGLFFDVVKEGVVQVGDIVELA
jgi:molybdopterin adenylyltransferase